MLPLILKFLTDNPWRTVALCSIVATALITFTLYSAMLFHRNAAREAVISRDTLKLEISKITATGIVQAERIKIVTDELSKMKKRQLADASRIKKLLADWPEECDDAADSALDLLKGELK